MSDDIIYLDNNATTRIDPEVFGAMRPWLEEHYGNPSSAYLIGRKARVAVEGARRQVAAALGVREAEVLFTGCGTESINTAILSACSLDPDRRRIVTSAVEHSATLKLCEQLARKGYEISRLGVDSGGRLHPGALEEALDDEVAVVSLLWANNETGVLFPVCEIARICRERGVLLHLDAVQAVGKVPVDLSAIEPDFVSISGHKLHCPKGVGALFASRRVRFTPLLNGGQERGRRGGTENVASIVALGAAAALCDSMLAEEQTRVRKLRDDFEAAVLGTVPDCEINGDRLHRLPNTSNISFAGIESEGALIMLDEEGICCSAGSACTTGSVEPSHVLRAMGFSGERARASLRFSFGRFNTEEEVAEAAEVVARVIKKLREVSPSVSGASPVRFAAGISGGESEG